MENELDACLVSIIFGNKSRNPAWEFNGMPFMKY